MRRIALTIATIIASVGVLVGTASAFNEADFQKLKTTHNCVDCDLSGALVLHWKLAGADLSGANLAGADLTETYLAGANLAGANLSGAILISTSLADANLIGAKLGGANLLYTDLSGATWVDGSRCKRPSSGWCKK